jgi:hypothetical protein
VSEKDQVNVGVVCEYMSMHVRVQLRMEISHPTYAPIQTQIILMEAV